MAVPVLSLRRGFERKRISPTKPVPVRDVERKGRTSDLPLDISLRKAFAGGQDEQPCDVKSSTTYRAFSGRCHCRRKAKGKTNENRNARCHGDPPREWCSLVLRGPDRFVTNHANTKW